MGVVHIRKAIVAIAVSIIPLCAHAESITNWSFLGGQVGPEWLINGQFKSAADMGGLHIITESDVNLFRKTQTTQGVDAVEITYLSLQKTEAALIWHLPGTPENEVVRLPVTLAESSVPVTKHIDAGRYDEWIRYPEVVGLRLPAGSDIQILQIRLVGWSLPEKVWNAVLSYWTFDVMSPYSVNFLWGPILTGSPIARDALFTDLPPKGLYANIAAYVLLLLVGAGAVTWAIISRRRKHAAVLFAIIAGSLWILSDIRMGLEIVSYAVRDVASVTVERPEDQRFRERANFPAFLHAVAPLVTDRGRYVFLTQYPYPFLGLMRYHTHPALPVGPEAAADGLDTWVVFARGDIGINEQNQLTAEGKIISPPGDVLLEFAPDTFVFRTR